MCSTSSNVNFTEEARWYGSQTPHQKGTNSYSLVHPKSPNCKFAPAPPKEQHSWKIAKEDGPAPGSYQDSAAFNVTTKKKEFTTQMKSTEKRKSFVETFAALYAKNPTMCHYKEIGRGYAVRTQP